MCSDFENVSLYSKVDIGLENPGEALDVAGNIRTHKVSVCLDQGCDFVFEPDYNLMSLDELDNFISNNKHLPEVAPAAIMESEGINLSEMNALLFQKIEELTLYMIAQDKKNNCIRERNSRFKSRKIAFQNNKNNKTGDIDIYNIF